MNKLVNDDACIAQWRSLLKMFKNAIADNPTPEAVKDQLANIRELASACKDLTFHQVSAIHARCDNYMNGEYGNTKVDANFGHGPQPATK